MPFLTEELWQRLPGRGTWDEATSIMISEYPQSISEWTDLESETNMEVLMKVITAARSLKNSYNLANSAKPAIYVCCNTEEMKNICSAQSDDIKNLSKVQEPIFYPRKKRYLTYVVLVSSVNL